MAEQGYDDRDPDFLSGALLDGWYAPALRGASGNGIGRWTEDELVAFLKKAATNMASSSAR